MKPIAEGQEKWIGNIWSHQQLEGFTNYWNQVTAENAGKWGSVEHTRGNYNWNNLDASYNLAKENGFPYRFHVLIWGGQQPGWINDLSTEDQLEAITQWMDAVAARYPDMEYVEVVNEGSNGHQLPDGQSGSANYIEALGGTGETGHDWIITAFEMARERFPNSKLMINDYNIVSSETWGSQNARNYMRIIEDLQERDLIDVIGVQSHAFSTPGSQAQIRRVLDQLAATGLPIQATEMDIQGDSDLSQEESDQLQLENMQRVFPVFWEHPAVEGITFWGWRSTWMEDAELIYSNGEERPALQWLREYVENWESDSSEQLDPSLWNWVPFDEGSGGVAADATDAGRDATLAGGAGWGQGRNGSALSLPGTNGSYAGLPAGIVSDLDAITIGAWVYWEGGGNWQRIFDFGHDTSRYLFLTPRSGSGTLRFAITPSGGPGNEQLIESGSALSIGSWNHVAVTISGNTGRLFLNGNQVGLNSAMTLRPSDLGVTPNNWIGRSQWADPYFNGRVEDFRIYSGALTPDQIADLVQLGAVTPPPPTGLQVVPQAERGVIELSWEAVVEADEYNVWRASGEDDYQMIADGLTETFFADQEVMPEVLYSYRLTSVNAAGESSPSTETSVELPSLIGVDDARVQSIRSEGGNIVLKMPSVSGFQYQLQRRYDLASGEWEDVGGPVPASGEEIEFSDIHDSEAVRAFYRVVIRPDI